MLSTLLALALHAVMNFWLLRREAGGGKDREWDVIPARVRQWVGEMALNKYITMPGLSLIGVRWVFDWGCREWG